MLLAEVPHPQEDLSCGRPEVLSIAEPLAGGKVPRMSRVVLVLGTGSIGMRHLTVLSGLEGIVPVAVPVRPAKVATLRAEGRQAAPLDDALAMSPVAAIVATDTGRHVADTTTLLRHGCHVLTEKPLSPTTDGLAELARLRHERQRSVFVACCLRFHPGLRRFKDELGSIGPVHHVRIECQSHLPDWRPGVDHRTTYAARADEGGVLRDLIHEIDYASWIFGRPASVLATLTPGDSLGIASEAAADLMWQAGGATIVIRLDYLTRESRRRMTAFGRNGEITWDAIANTVSVKMHSEGARVYDVVFDRNSMMRAQAQTFLAAAADAAADDALATFDDGAFAVAVCDAARTSASSRRSEPVADWRTK